MTEFEKELRYAYRNKAINYFGKHYKELKQPEIKIILDEIIKQYFPLRPYIGSVQISKEEFLIFFRKVFHKEWQRSRVQ